MKYEFYGNVFKRRRRFEEVSLRRVFGYKLLMQFRSLLQNVVLDEPSSHLYNTRGSSLLLTMFFVKLGSFVCRHAISQWNFNGKRGVNADIEPRQMLNLSHIFFNTDPLNIINTCFFTLWKLIFLVQVCHALPCTQATNIIRHRLLYMLQNSMLFMTRY